MQPNVSQSNPSVLPSQNNVIIGVSVGAAVSFLFCLSLYFYWLYRRYKLMKISSIKDHSPFELQIQRTRWETLQSPTSQYLAGLTSKHLLYDLVNQYTIPTFYVVHTAIVGESDALSVPAYLAMNWEESIRLIDQIGTGTAGFIYRAELLDFKLNNHTINDSTVAVKVFKQELVNLTSFHQEVAIMAKLSFCPYVMRLYGYIEEKTRLAIVMRLCPYSLHELIHNRTAFNINARVWKCIFSDAIRGIVAMHSAHIAHLDVKPSNIMIECTRKTASSFTPLLTDFGLSQSFAKSNIKGWQISKVKGASIQYCDPQTLKLIELGTIKHVKLSQAQAFARDQYSLGITGWEIITRQRPWHEMDTEAIMTAVLQFNKRPTWPKESSTIDWKHIVESMWTFEGRIPLQEALLALDNHDDIINLSP